MGLYCTVNTLYNGTHYNSKILGICYLCSIKFCSTSTFLGTNVIVKRVHCTQLYIIALQYPGLDVPAHNPHGYLFLSNQGAWGRYIANCIDIDKEVGRDPHLSIFPSPGRTIISAEGPQKLSRSSAGLLI